MKTENAIEVKDITKKFKVYYDKGNQLKEKLLFHKRNRYEDRWVLKGISFEVKKGEAIGLVGHNGCGKSTLLKLLTKIIYPDSGTIEMNGRVSSMLELGAGFHPDMSGRENIYTNAAIFGLTKKEIEERIEDIIAFSELEEFIDNPVRTYSSGMYMRLAFAVAINVDADILLIDEILAVGDSNFQAKCFNRLREIKADGVTIVIVSHSLGQIEQICERSIWIHNGEIALEGTPREVHPEYLNCMKEKRQEVVEKERERKEKQRNKNDENEKEKSSESNNDTKQEKQNNEQEEVKRWGNAEAHIKDVQMLDETGKKKYIFETGQKVNIRIEYEISQTVSDAVIGIGIFRVDGLQCYGTNTRIDQKPEFDLECNGTMIVELENLNLLAGEYLLDVAIEKGYAVPVDYYREAYRFEVHSPIGDVGVSRISHQWILEKENGNV